MLHSPNDIRSIVFDLDGTLYLRPEVGEEIFTAAAGLVSESRGISITEAKQMLRRARQRLTETLEETPTLTHTCQELGIDIRSFHHALLKKVRPERYLEADPILYALLDSLQDRYDLYLYTNNSLPLAQKILALLGIEELFRRLYTIEFTWSPKPDPESFHHVLEDIGGPPESFLFVGDRPQVDLKIAESLQIPTIFISDPEDLLQIHKVLGLIP
ncbi:HAD family hydrolase [Desulfuromonas sp. TF]|uniref:HAD family hydrolase n=1 Tax=Desulfuromonas sp. TF TaxID=1232410 RepID=UPI0004084C7B|nr:HAD family hydrolase [Desulfuromonas sp. TF]